MRKSILSLFAMLLAFALVLGFSGCEALSPKDEPVKPAESDGTEPDEPEEPDEPDEPDEPEEPEDPDDPTPSSGEEPEEKLPSVSLDNRSLTLAFDETAVLTATTENSDKQVVWALSAEDILTYKINGNSLSVTAGKTEGTVTVTAALEDTDYTASCTVTVVDSTVPVESVTLDETEIALEVKERRALSAVVLPEDATDKTVTWSSSDTSVITVDQSGTVKAIKAGSATVSAKCGNAVATCSVTVNKPYVPVQGLLVSRSTLSLAVGASSTLKATVSPTDATNPAVVWSSEDESIATVENGTVRALKEGTVKIKCKTEDGEYTATCRVVVSSSTISVTGVSLNHSSLTLSVGSEGVLKASVIPNNATNRKVVWSSSDEEVVTVSDSGVLTAVGEGTAKITVKTEDGQFKDSCNISVNADLIPVEVVGLSSSAKSFTKIGDTFNLAAYFSPTNASDQSVTWDSDNPSVATVSSAGKVTSVGEGVAVITVTTNDGGKTAQCLVVVSVEEKKVTALSVTEPEAELLIGDTLKIYTRVSPTDATDKRLFWSSDNEKVALVSADGIVRAVGQGKAVITATSLSGNVSATCTVSVEPNNTGLEGELVYFHEMYVGTQGGYSGATGIEWASSDESVVTVSDSGTFTAQGVGEAWVTASADGHSARMKVIVYDMPSRFVLTSQTNDIGCFVGETCAVPFEVRYTEETDNPTRLLFTSDNPSVCTVDASGTVWAHAVGTATVTANAVLYSDASAVSFTVTVSENPSVSVSDKKFTLGDTIQSSFYRLGSAVNAVCEKTTDSLGNACMLIECYYHDEWNNLTVLSYKNARLCSVYTADSRLSYSFNGQTVTYKTELEDSARHVYDGYEMTTSEEIMRGYFLEADYTQSGFVQRVFTDVLNEYEKGSDFTDDGNMTVLAVLIASNDYYRCLENMTDMTACAYQLYALTNAWRVANGLNALAFDADAAAVGKAHCADMDANGYFAHKNLSGKWPKDRIADAGIEQKGVGENLAMGQTSGFEAFFSLLNSSGHRDNLADKRYAAVGVGATNNVYGDTGYTRQMYAQEFLIR